MGSWWFAASIDIFSFLAVVKTVLLGRWLLIIAFDRDSVSCHAYRRIVQDADYQRSQRDCCGPAPPPPRDLGLGVEDRFEVRGLAADR